MLSPRDRFPRRLRLLRQHRGGRPGVQMKTPNLCFRSYWLTLATQPDTRLNRPSSRDYTFSRSIREWIQKRDVTSHWVSWGRWSSLSLSGLWFSHDALSCRVGPTARTAAAQEEASTTNAPRLLRWATRPVTCQQTAGPLMYPWSARHLGPT